MMGAKRIVLDANILLRAVFGVKVRALLESYEDSVSFFSPEICFEDARRYIPELGLRRALNAADGLVLLHEIARIVEPVPDDLYEEQRDAAIARIGLRDMDDWPVVALALVLDCPIWTEDRDFFGSGVATWTTANVELYLGS
jgi:predicted nucleic acid-binding protein